MDDWSAFVNRILPTLSPDPNVPAPNDPEANALAATSTRHSLHEHPGAHAPATPSGQARPHDR
jgi:hypothetical protein